MSTTVDSQQYGAAVLRHLPLLREMIDRLGIRDVVHRELPPDPRNRVVDADCVVLMIENVLHGRVALYGMNDWLEATDIDVILGEGCPADAFTDDRLAATLDHIHAYGVDDLLSAVVRGYLQQNPGPSEYSVHTDTTTAKLWGDYERATAMPGPSPLNGHSKDHRPDLKQLVYGLSLHGAVGIPLCVSVLDGNTSDHTANRLHIDQLAGLLPPQDDVTLVADCKLFDPTTIGRILDADFHFVTLVPRTYGLRAQLVDLVLQRDEALPELARSPGQTSKHPDRVYCGVSFVRDFAVLDPEQGDSQEKVPLRFLVVESSEQARSFDEGLQKRLEKDRKRYEQAARKLAAIKYRCGPDAQLAIDRFENGKKSKALHTATFGVEEVTKVLPRPKRGRPKAGELAPTETFWKITWADVVADEAAVKRARDHARFFVLATDHVLDEGWDDERILTEYRHQHMVEGHCGFRWLKGPAAVAPMFLKTPARIAALGLVFILALMVRNYMQWEIRRRLAETDQTLPNMNKQPTARPTTENIFHYFGGVTVALVYRNGRVAERHVSGLNEAACKALEILGVSPTIFTTPRKADSLWLGSSE